MHTKEPLDIWHTDADGLLSTTPAPSLFRTHLRAARIGPPQGLGLRLDYVRTRNPDPSPKSILMTP